ncbi:transcriptional regulator [Phyllobacterium myrsinacearum]|uniref:Uncharacterized protein n=1 Tax=Phyllobacterium myrsinacearum TaxID=28101 RepID=A0A839EWI5_9HYPH|nr:transcriptional regulator [Phyllobacterium myrsinacearum]MBA8880880.1 hypothetical protein [Phyllobacterium myrsinacearum]
MKKAQRGFAIEYKSSRRKSEPKSNSIWGNINLTAVVQDMQEEKSSFLQVDAQSISPAGEGNLPAGDPAELFLTEMSVHQTTVPNLEETIMADEDTTIDAGAPANVAPAAPKMQRKPRARKAVAEAGPVEIGVGTAAGKQKNARKPRSDQGKSRAKRLPISHASKTAQTVTALTSAAIDEIADLEELEEENRKLRALLAEKLRAENAELRKRLNLG